MTLFLSIVCGILVMAVVTLSALLWKKREEDHKELVDIKEVLLKVQRKGADYEKFTETISQLVVIIPVALRASSQIQDFENFFQDSLEDVSSVLEMLEKLMKRQVISDDPDVQNFYRVMAITHDTLLGYRNASKEREEEKE